MCIAAAERKIAPIFVGLTTSSSTAMRFAFSQISLMDGSFRRCIAQSMPRVSLKPVIFVSTSNSAVYTGICPQRFMICFASPSTCFFSTRIEIGSYPASSARSTTFGLSAIKIPSSGFARFKSWISFVLAYTSSFGSSKSVISMISDNFAVSFIKNGSDILAAECTSCIA